MRKLFGRLTTIKSLNDDVQRRGKIVVMLALSLQLMALLSLPLSFLTPRPVAGMLATLGAIFIDTLVLMLARRGQVTLSGYLLLTAIAGPILGGGYASEELSSYAMFLVLPIVVASLILRPAQVWLVFALMLGGVALLAGLSAPELRSDTEWLTLIINSVFLIFITTVLGFLGSWVTDTVFRSARELRVAAEQSAVALERANAELDERVAERTGALQQALADVEARSADQAALLHEVEQQRVVIRELSVPVLPMSDSTLVMPLVGALDTVRLNDLQQQALTAIERSSARRLLLDITGVPIVDTQVAKGLINVMQAARLLGAEVVLVGVRPEVAQAVVGLGLSLSGMQTFRDLQTALTTSSTRPNRSVSAAI